jgi:hypothetical protein
MAGIAVFQFLSRSSALPESNMARPSGQDMCRLLDQIPLAKCNITTGVVVPECALGKYNELVLGYPGLGACDSAHMALVALAVATTNHDVDDPYLFFAMSTLYFDLQGPSWYINRNWLEGPSPCSNNWHGVSCSGGKISIELLANGTRSAEYTRGPQYTRKQHRRHSSTRNWIPHGAGEYQRSIYQPGRHYPGNAG